VNESNREDRKKEKEEENKERAEQATDHLEPSSILLIAVSPWDMWGR